MTIQEVIAMVDEIKPNAFSTATKVKWLDTLEGTLAAEVFLMAPEQIAELRLSASNLTVELLVSPPYDDMYEYWLEAQIDRANGEYDKYANTMQFFNARHGDFVTWFCQQWDPAQGYGDGCTGGDNRPPYYITAYSIACKHGYTGTEEEWLEELVTSEELAAHYVTAGQRSGYTPGVKATAEGFSVNAGGRWAHAEGWGTVAGGEAAHADGSHTEALGAASHASGSYTRADGNNQFVFGRCNAVDPEGRYVEIVGNGSVSQRSNARTLDWEGSEALAGSLTLGMGTDDETTITAAQLKALLALL